MGASHQLCTSVPQFPKVRQGESHMFEARGVTAADAHLAYPLVSCRYPTLSLTLWTNYVRAAETGEWALSGGGKAKFGVAGASGELDILYDGVATSFVGL